MNRILLCVVLIVAFACVQGISLHGHRAHAPDSHSAITDHEPIHLHSHPVSTNIDRDHEHSESIEVDLLGTALARHTATPTIHLALVAVWALILTVLWVCIRRSPPTVPLVHFGPPPVLRPSPRAPPR